MIVRKPDFEIEARLMDRLRGNRNCMALKGFRVVPEGADGRWCAQPVLKKEAHLPLDGERAVTQAVREMSCQYWLLKTESNSRRA